MYLLISSRKHASLIAGFVALVLCSNVFGHHPVRSSPQVDALVYVMGVGRLQEPGNDIPLDSDCDDMLAKWKSMEGRLYRKVDTMRSINEEATCDHVRADMKKIEDLARPGLVINTYVIGHGGCGSGTWQFCAYDGYISAKEFREWVERLTKKGATVFLFVGSCHSGAIDIHVDHAVVITSCSAEQTALAGNPCFLNAHSLFCLALLEALSGEADANHDGIVTLGEVIDYLQKRVPELAAEHADAPDKPHAQEPTASTGGLPLDTPLAVLDNVKTDAPSQPVVPSGHK